MKLTVEEIRTAICEAGVYPFKGNLIDLKKVSDAELLKADFEKDLSLDSLDVVLVAMALERIAGISFPDSSYGTLRKNGNTVQALLDECNRLMPR